MLVVELEALFRSNTEWMAGEEYAVVEAPPSKAVKSSKSERSERAACERGAEEEGSNFRSAVRGWKATARGGGALPWRFILPCGMLPVLWENKGTGGRARRWLFCWFRATDEDGADEA